MPTSFGSMNTQMGGGQHTGATTLSTAFNGHADFRQYTFSELNEAAMKNGVDKIPKEDLPRNVIALLANVQELWNLQRSEAARRVYIDAWLTAAMQHARNGTATIIPEEGWGSTAGRPGYGKMDYLLCEMVGTTVATTQPEYAPSVIVEAKLDLSTNPYDGVGQLVAEIDTVRTMRNYNTDPLRGIITDGRHWRFVEVLPIHKDVNMTPLYDSGTPGGWRAGTLSNVREVWGRLRQFLSRVRFAHPVMT